MKNKRNLRHGMSRTTEYRQWVRIMQKCYNYNSRGYKNYGLHGIRVCNDWLDFVNFYDWLKENNRADTARVLLKPYKKEFSPENCILLNKKGA